MIVPGDKGNNRFSVGRSICIGTFPDKKAACDRKRDIKAEFAATQLKSASERQALSRPAWDVEQELLVKPSFLMQEDVKKIKTGKITSRKNCECPFRC
jgi:hypothetical protein